MLAYPRKNQKISTDPPRWVERIAKKESIAEGANPDRYWCSRVFTGPRETTPWICTRGSGHPGLCMTIYYSSNDSEVYATWRPDDSD